MLVNNDRIVLYTGERRGVSQTSLCEEMVSLDNWCVSITPKNTKNLNIAMQNG